MFKEVSPSVSSISIFSNMPSILNPSTSAWPLSLELPSLNPSSSHSVEKLPNIFTEEIKKKCKAVTACPHSSRKHYAKNMCNNCYHRLGRDKNAWACTHSERKHYAKGMCQFCYLKHYNKSRHEVHMDVNTASTD